MNVSGKCISIIKKSLIDSGFIGGVSKEDADALSKHYLSTKRINEQILLFERYGEIKGHFLEIGSGFGGFVTYLNHTYSGKCIAFGVEPSRDAYSGTMESTRQLMQENGIRDRFVSAEGENLPFKTGSFDRVYSTSVLEHVRSPEKVVRESVRVLKKGGILQFVVPNYGSWWEGHYGILMLPHMPKWLLKIYVKLYGRDSKFVDTLQFITRSNIDAILQSLDDEIKVLSYGTKVFEERLTSIDFSEWASLAKLKKWVLLIHKFHIVNLVVYLGKKFHWETPIILTLKKM